MVSASPHQTPGLSVIIPAHDEERRIGRLLAALTAPATGAESNSPMDIIVVCNGCTDDTARVARAFGDGVRVAEIPEASKSLGMHRGDQLARFPARAYVDADVVIDGRSLRDLHSEARRKGWLACAPERELVTVSSSCLVRWYYDVWRSLPQVQEGLFGRGVVLVTSEGWKRLAALPDVVADDLVRSEAFQNQERGVSGAARVEIEASRTMRGLVRRRIRVVRGTIEADGLGLLSAESQTSLGSLRGIVARDPRLALKLPVFISVAVWARIAAARTLRRGGQPQWERDETTR